VLDHSGPGDEFQVSVGLDETDCVIRVVDAGRGFDWESLGPERAASSAERGRGIELMRALVDNVKFESRAETGTIVHLTKRLEFSEDSVVRRLADRREASRRPA
jgi:serine/threonine-protein kinase RsbW